MISTFPSAPGHRRPAAFSLVEVTISLGLVAFALVGILGALPLAMSSGRYSFEQTRASSIANTLFASMRSQTFTKVYYLTGVGAATTQSGPYVDLSSDIDSAAPAQTGSPSTIQLYAAITDGMVTGEGLQFQNTRDNAEFSVTLHTNKLPGASSDPKTATMPASGMANQVEVAISALDHPKDIYRFISVIASRAQ